VIAGIRSIAFGLIAALGTVVVTSVEPTAAAVSLAHDDDDDRDDDRDGDDDGGGGDGGVDDDGPDDVDDLDDPEDVAAYDELPPNLVWPATIGLDAVGRDADGSGVTVAVVDTGVTRVPELGDRVLARVDLTPEGDGYDRYGHGTHMVGIVAGDDSGGGGVRGVAPGVHVVSVKVAGWSGATDVSTMIAGLEWIAAHRDQYGIRIVNVSFGTDSSQKYLEDPLDAAVERLWEAGVLVVASAGNRGDGGSKIDKPADDPFVLTVGAADLRGTVSTADDRVAPFSSCGPTGDGLPKPDVVAPGVSIVSSRAAGSTIDWLRPAARVSESALKGSGTSQATAIVSGMAALMFESRPSLTPDEAKAALVGTAATIAGEHCVGAGLVHAGRALDAVANGAYTGIDLHGSVPRSSGLGSIDSTRGSHKPYTDLDGDGVAEQVSGEIDALGNPWLKEQWAARPWGPDTWPSSPWAPLTRVSPGWEATPRGKGTWAGAGWDDASWSAKSWRDAEWTSDTWSAKSWRDANWNSLGAGGSSASDPGSRPTGERSGAGGRR
jgi:serine protease AprX